MTILTFLYYVSCLAPLAAPIVAAFVAWILYAVDKHTETLDELDRPEDQKEGQES